MSRIIETERLILRHWKLSDAEDMFRYASNPKIGLNAGFMPHKSIQDSIEIIKRFEQKKYGYAVCLKSDNKAIGSIELKFKDYPDLLGSKNYCEIGYWIGEPFWGNGYITEATKSIIKLAFEELEVENLWIGYFVNNYQSKRVQEKCGFVYIKTLENVDFPLINEKKIVKKNLLTRERYFYLKEKDKL